MSIAWAAFDGFSRPIEQRTWAGVLAWTAVIQAALGAERSALAQQRRSSDTLLRDLGGDPNARDWTSFLPLRRHREEDWSDWLAQLIEDSKTGRFAVSLLGEIEARKAPSDYLVEKVHRETLHEDYRADLVIEWKDASYTHIEVKVGDPHLGKTLETSYQMERRFDRHLTRRADVVLLLPEQQEAWEAECRKQPSMGDRVKALDWSGVARALRSALPKSARESIHWRVWAHAFCGAVEQDLLRLRFGRQPGDWARALTFQGLATAAKLFTPNGDA
jgi:hypothetical protein